MRSEKEESVKRSIVMMAGAVMLTAVAGCAGKSGSGAADTTEAAKAAVAVPASSPLAKVHAGMNKQQVKDVLGAPTAETSYATGKAWIPWYFGNDTRRTSYFYKSVGRVIFADGNVFGGGGGGEVVVVEYDPSEVGVAK